MSRRSAGQIAATLIPLLVTAIAVALITAQTGPSPHHSPAARPHTRRVFTGLVPRGWANGVALARFADLGPFEQATGERPQIVVIYASLATRFPTAEARSIAARGALPLVQINPRGMSLRKIVAGRYDGQLRAYAAEIHRAGTQTALSFAHEANGNWYPWGCATPASVYVAAWRHVHQIIGTRNVIWVWTTDHGWKGNRCRLMARYPGARWTDWIGVDGYIRQRGATFASVFGPTLGALRKTGKPLLIAEAGAPAGPRQAGRITGLYAGARAAGVFGVVYFDSATVKGNYRPQDTPAALAAFRRAITTRSPRK